jgi:branched-chain amino acid transport system permease protein
MESPSGRQAATNVTSKLTGSSPPLTHALNSRGYPQQYERLGVLGKGIDIRHIRAGNVTSESMTLSFDLLGNALVSGLLLGGFYAAVTIGVSISFGMLDIVNIAHPAFVILGSYTAYVANSVFGMDPIISSIVLVPAYYLAGVAIYCVYDVSFERRGDTSIRGLAFFFGILFITEVTLVLVFGVDYRLVDTPYVGPSLHIGVIDLPLRLLIPCLVSLALIGTLQLFMSYTFIGRAVQAVAQDPVALRLMAVDPNRIKRIAFGLSIASASIAGAILIIIQPVEPSIGRDYIGRIFAICVMGGLGSFGGTVVAAMILGIMESLTSTFYGPSWSPAVAFGFLLITLAVLPSGLFGRR